MIDRIIEIEGDTWKVIGVGVTNADTTYCHLASTTRFREQRNGKVPVQMADWIPTQLFAAVQS